ncbi:phosphoglucomutase (alpha-D-glucose-1,6-bisphosphate-dependent) [Desulfovibrio sp. OttesenSCG-928-C14]|nr:phosphoglucomutase (alpha-D-glucose-1,6-bisphosphate-dependent) [Desulfovibrio sp. OttesenSCG-928-C14]
MSISPLAGQKAPAQLLLDVKALLDAYHEKRPDPENPAQRVSFGTSGHRGSSLNSTFTETHILAVTQAVCEQRRESGVSGPLFMGMDTHALSASAQRSALEVLAANEVSVLVHAGGRVTPTPVISFSILDYNTTKAGALADGIVITPSHNPPEDGGFKYNPPHGGPADTAITARIEARANQLIADGLRGVRRIPYERAVKSPCVREYDYITPYVAALPEVVDLESIAASGLKLGADALGGSAFPYWGPIAEKYGLNLEVLNAVSDPQFSFMTVDRDGKIRMDCSSPWAMAGLIGHASRYDLSFANDPDADRHGIVTPSGIMNPNHYLAAAVAHLLSTRTNWKAGAKIGKTMVTSAILDQVAASFGRGVFEVPVGFKWFVEPLLSGACVFGGEESAGASFLRRDGRAWTTDKDGIILNLLAAEMTAKSGKTPDLLYRDLTERFGVYYYERRDAPANSAQKSLLKKLSAGDITASSLAGDAITGVFTSAPGNNAAFGGLKVATQGGWFAARPSGTEDVYKIYAESRKSAEHLESVMEEAQTLVSSVFARAK